MINTNILGFYKVKRTMGCHSCHKKMQKDDVYLKIELSTNRKNYCEVVLKNGFVCRRILNNESWLV